MRTLLLLLFVTACAPRAAPPTVPDPGNGAAAPSPEIPAPSLPALSDIEQQELDLALIRLSFEDPERRLLGARALESLGSKARSGLVDLYDCLARDPDLGVAAACARAMVAIGDDARPYLADNPALDGPRAALAVAAVESLDDRALRADARP